MRASPLSPTFLPPLPLLAANDAARCRRCRRCCSCKLTTDRCRCNHIDDALTLIRLLMCVFASVRVCVHPVFCCCCAFFATIGTTHNRTTTTKVAQQCECECACKQQAENLMCAFPVRLPFLPLDSSSYPLRRGKRRLYIAAFLLGYLSFSISVSLLPTPSFPCLV